MKTKLTYLASKYGAQMGRPNRIPKDITESTNLYYYEQLRWVDEDYDEGGCYWGRVIKNGIGDYIYRVQGETETEQVEIFVRAKNLKEASKEVKKTVKTFLLNKV
jgi:hypothetical protein